MSRRRELVPATAAATPALLGELIGAETAAELLAHCDGSLRALAARIDELPTVRGLGPAARRRVAAAVELGRRLSREAAEERARIRGPRDVYELLAPRLRDELAERFVALTLNTQHRVVRERVVTIGTIDASIVHPREVFRSAIADSAAALILAHNHPSGDPTPSAEDRDVTRQLAEAGRLVGIPVLDHIVIGDGRYVSFVEAGLGLPL